MPARQLNLSALSASIVSGIVSKTNDMHASYDSHMTNYSSMCLLSGFAWEL